MFNFDLVADSKCVFLIIWELKVLYHETVFYCQPVISLAHVQSFFLRYRRPAPFIVNPKRWVSSAFSFKYASVDCRIPYGPLAALKDAFILPLEARCCCDISVSLTLKINQPQLEPCSTRRVNKVEWPLLH